MQRIIDGKRYDTTTAVLIAVDHGQEWTEETYLYKTKKGNFFQHKKPSLMEECAGSITPLSEATAKECYGLMPEWKMSYADVFGCEPEEA